MLMTSRPLAELPRDAPAAPGPSDPLISGHHGAPKCMYTVGTQGGPWEMTKV